MYINKFIVAISLLITTLSAQNKINLDYLIFSTQTPEQKFSLEDGATYCEMLTLYGLSDWQLPNDKELSMQSDEMAFWSSEDEDEDLNTMRKALCVHQKETPKECFRFNKSNFKQSLKKPQDIIVEANELKFDSKDNHSIYIWFAKRDTPNAKENIDFSCDKEDNSSAYMCYSEEDRGGITAYLKDDALYMQINRINMSDDIGSPLTNSHYIKSINAKFSRGERVDCGKGVAPYQEVVLRKTVEDDLLNSARAGYVEGVLSALDNGANIDTTDNHGDTALAIGIEHLKIVKLLLNYDAKIELESGSMLRLAIENGNATTLQLLLDNGLKPSLERIFSDITDDNRFELDELFIIGDNNIVRVLLKNGAEVDIKDKNGYRPIDKAILAKDIILLKTLIEYNAKVDKRLKSKICNGKWAEGCIYIKSIKH